MGRFAETEDWATTRALGDKCGVDEAIIRRWGKGDEDGKAMPFAALMVLPAPLAVELVRWVQDTRALSPSRRATVLLAEAIERIPSNVSEDDRADLLRALGDLSSRLQDAIIRLATEKR